jgi:hypothetical protein
MRSRIARLLIFGFLATGSLAANAGSTGFQKLEGPPGGIPDWLASTPSAQFLGTEAGIYKRKGTSGPWVKALPSGSGGSILTHGDTVVIYGDTGYVSVDAGSSWRIFTPPDYMRRPIALGRHGLLIIAGLDWLLYRSLDLGRSWQLIPGRGIESGVEWGDGWVLKGTDGINFLDAATGSGTWMSKGLSEGGSYDFSSDGTTLLASEFMGGTYRYDAQSKGWEPVGLRWARGGAVFRGDTIYQATDSAWFEHPVSPDSFRWYRSPDRGIHWTLEKVFPPASRVAGMAPVGGEVLALVNGDGVAKVGAGNRLIPDNEGLRDSFFGNLALSGNDFYAYMQFSGRVFHSQDRGQHWSYMASTASRADLSHVFAVGKDVFLEDSTFFGRWRAAGSAFDSVAHPPSGYVADMKDAGDRFIAYAIRREMLLSQSGHIQGYKTYGTLAVSPKNPIQWMSLPLPRDHFTGWDTDGAGILGTDDSTLAWSRDGGQAWVTLAGLPFSRPNAIRFTGGKWFVSSAQGVFRSADPGQGGWEPTLLAASPVLVGANGQRLLAQGQDKVFRFSPDLGASWSILVNPRPGATIGSVLMSDSLLCLFGNLPGNSVSELYCSDWETVPLPVRRSGRTIRPRAGSGYYQGKWRLMTPPAQNGAPPLFVDPRGRVFPPR